MVDKRFQVFVSSTFSDLKEERQEVMQALLELDCIPSGMELFPAANDDQWSLIKKVIDDCDYYVLIIAGRYGSLSAKGVSYTEMEFDYAVEKGKPTIAFVHADPGKIPSEKSETNSESQKKLEVFKEKVRKKVCKFWNSPQDLGSKVSRSVIKLIKNEPAVGWVRGDQVLGEDAASEILRLKQKLEDLNAQIGTLRVAAPAGADKLAQGDDKFSAHLNFDVSSKGGYTSTPWKFEVKLSWNELFGACAPSMIDECDDRSFKLALSTLLVEAASISIRHTKELKGKDISNPMIDSQDFKTIKVQFRALGLISRSVRQRSVKDTKTYWTLTPLGDETLTSLRAIRRSSD